MFPNMTKDVALELYVNILDKKALAPHNCDKSYNRPIGQ